MYILMGKYIFFHLRSPFASFRFMENSLKRERRRNSVFYPSVCFTVEKKMQEFSTVNVIEANEPLLKQYRSDLAPCRSVCVTRGCTRRPTSLWPFYLHCTSAFLSVSYTASPSQLNQMVRPNECSISPVRPSYVQNTE